MPTGGTFPYRERSRTYLSLPTRIDSLSGALASGEPPQIAYLRRGGLR